MKEPKCIRLFLIGFSFMFTLSALNAQSARALLDSHAQTRYKLVDLGTFGGPQSYINLPDISYAPVLNNSGVVAGWADTLDPDPYPDFCFDGDCLVAHAF